MTEDGEFSASEYLGHQLLIRLQEEKGHISRSFFFKAWCLADRYIESELDFETGLPRYWYMYGEIPDETTVSDEFYYSNTTSWGRKYQPIYNIDLSRFDISKEEKDILDQGVRWAISRFGKRNTDFVKSLQYTEHAPNEFIRTYSELRDYLEYTDLDNQAPLQRFPEYESNQEVVEHLLDEMMITYPKEDFEEMYKLYLRWDDTARILLNSGVPFSEFEDFLDRFIEALSKVVIQISFSEDMPPNRVDRWQDERDDAKEEFADWLTTQRNELLDGRESSGLLDDLAEPYDQSVENSMSELFTLQTE